MRFIANYLMRGRMQAVLVVSVFILFSFMLPPLNIISGAGVALVTLRNGYREGLSVTIIAAIVVAVFGQVLIGNPVLTLVYALGFWIPIAIFSVILRETRQLGLTLEIILGLGLLGIAAVYLMDSNPSAIWQQRLQLVLQPLMKNPPPELDPNQIETGILAVSHYMTGILVTGTIVTLVLALLLGRWWQAQLYNPGGFREEFLQLKSHLMIAYIFLMIFAVAGFSSGTLGEGMRNASILAFFFYLIVGIAVLHVVISATSMRGFLLPAMYVLMFFVPHVLLPVALVGFTDTWANWRKRVTPTDEGV